MSEELTTREDASVASMLQTALAAGQSPETLERLFALYERMEAGKAEKALSAALAAFQGEAAKVIKNKDAAGKWKYAPLDVVVNTLRPVMTEHGLSHTFDTEPSEPGTIRVVCTIRHVGGARITSASTLPVEKIGTATGAERAQKDLSGAQRQGAAETYGQRRTLQAALGVTPSDEDTDGGVVEKIDDDQAEALCVAGEALGEERWAKFLKWAGVDEIADLPLSKYQAARRAIDKAVEGMKGGAK